MKIFITGATSGIGRELAEQYAANGVVLGLAGRRQDRLEEVAEAARARGAVAHVYPLDVVEREACAEAARDFVTAAGGVDLVIANAGMACVDRLETGDALPQAQTLSVNLLGVVHTLLPFVPTMVAQKRGQLVAVASVAGFRAVPWHTAYCASKAAVQALMDGYGMQLEEHGIRTTTINPGFVVSEITDKNDFHMPFLLTTERACRKIRRAIHKQKRVYTFPWQMAWIGRPLFRWAPRFLIKRLAPKH
ncbi:MAG: SDR family NAD(P)-dependent oxidoreductase [Planctomycetota bacterium]